MTTPRDEDAVDLGEFGPPVGGVAPPLQCNRLTGGNFDAPSYCGKPAEWHIIWDWQATNGLACQEHADEARRLWVFVGLHRYEPVCSIKGARWLHDEDRCVVTDDDLGLTATVEATVDV